jgi:Nitrogen regulatory protein PII
MKMIKAIVRPETEEKVTKGLEEAGFVSVTKLNVFGRGRQKGIMVGAVRYDELPKIMLMLVVEDDSADTVAEVIKTEAYTGNYGDGKIFVTTVNRAYTIRTGEAGL